MEKTNEGEFYSRPKETPPPFEAPFEVRAIEIYLGRGRAVNYGGIEEISVLGVECTRGANGMRNNTGT